jgi:hypothetical protein
MSIPGTMRKSGWRSRAGRGRSGRISPRRPGRSTSTASGRTWRSRAPGPLGNIFFRNHHPWLREYIGALVRELFPKPAVTVEGPAFIDVSLRKTADGKLCLHLLNRTNLPMPDRYDFTDFIPPIGPLSVEMECEAKPRAVRFVPEGEGGREVAGAGDGGRERGGNKAGRLKWTWRDGRLRVTVPRLDIHGVIVVD